MSTKKDIKKIKKELKKLGKTDDQIQRFLETSDEEERKRINENYEKFKEQYQWKPPGPIVPDDPNEPEPPEDDEEPEPEPEPTPTPEPGGDDSGEFDPEGGGDDTPQPGPEDSGDDPIVPTPDPEPTTPPQPTGAVIFDSHRDTRLHDSKVRTIKQEGELETRASGNPRIQVNNDGTFSLLCDAGHGRIYPYYRNYNSQLEIEFAFWKQAPGQDLSLKLRSRHNEGGAGENRFGGYGVSVDSSSWNAKREIFHNSHDQSKGGNLKQKLEAQKYYKIKFSVFDQGDQVRQTAAFDYGQGYEDFMNKIDTSPKPYMVDKKSYDAKSYFWIRSNIDSGTGEIRIKSVKLTAL